jgi:alpha-L-rhamnosidase
MGQNMVGWIRLKVKGNAGDSIRLRFAELLQKDGELYVANLRDARVTDTYIVRGDEAGCTWAPRFVYHGFRYVEVTGYPHATVNDFVGEVVNDEMETIGSFTTSNSTLNQIYRNAFWGIRGNYKGMRLTVPNATSANLGWATEPPVHWVRAS